MNVQFAKFQPQVCLSIGILLLQNGYQIIEKYELLIKSNLYEPTSPLKLLALLVKMTFSHLTLNSCNFFSGGYREPRFFT